MMQQGREGDVIAWDTNKQNKDFYYIVIILFCFSFVGSTFVFCIGKKIINQTNPRQLIYETLITSGFSKNGIFVFY